MKIAFISRATIFSSSGGDTQQLLKTAEYLRRMDVSVDVFRTDEQINYHQYDLLHFFNIIRPADIIHHIRASKKPYVVSTIYVDYGKVKEKEGKGMLRWVKKIVSPSQLEYLKVIARSIKNGEKIISKEYLWMGHRKAVRYIARHAACLLPNSQSEYNRFISAYNLDTPFRVIPNGIDDGLVTKSYPENDRYMDAVLCMGRFESTKNQLSLIRALNNTPYKVFLHGKPSPNNIAYYEQCKLEAAPNIVIGSHLDAEELYTAYANAKVHVLPSYFETTGLSSLEAAVMGCNIVVTDRGDTKDYFEGHAWFCEPDNPASIKEAVDKAFAAPYDEKFREHILTHYTWKRAAEETLAAYKMVLQPSVV